MNKNAENLTNDLNKFSNRNLQNNKDSPIMNDRTKNQQIDTGLINILRNYNDYENEKNINNYQKHNISNDDDYINLLSRESEVSPSENKIVFSNPMIKYSFACYNSLKRIITRKENVILINYLEKWKKNIQNIENKDYLMKNRMIIETYCEEEDSVIMNTDYNYLKADPNYSLKDSFSHSYDNYDLPLQSSQMKSQEFFSHEMINLCLSFKITIRNRLKLDLAFILNKLQQYVSSKKLTNSSLSLLYLFTQLAISKNKTTSNDKSKNQINCTFTSSANLEQKLFECEKKITKYESCLNEKADIIASRNDRIEQQLETIEVLSEEINRLNNKIDKLEKKSKNLNIVEESLCHKCGNSLEESFISHKGGNESYQLNETKKTIQEQLDYIVRMETDIKELKIKNAEYRTKNEIIINELEIIKSEFSQISLNLNNKKVGGNNLAQGININLVEASIQTEDSFNKKDFSIKESNKKSFTNLLKKSNKKFSSKLALKSTNTTQSEKTSNSLNNNITNYNIINISSGNMSSSKISQNNSTLSISMNDSEREILQSLKFDNSLLTQEIVNLNKEVTRLKSEAKQIVEVNKKLNKERTDINSKYKNKSENFDKLKKENEELMILIQTSNYKSFISVETENKKLKGENTNLAKEVGFVKSELTIKEKRNFEIESDLEKTKKNIESLLKYKSEREDLILENVKFESELKSIKYELENSKNIVERQNIVLKKQDEKITKLNEDMNYYNYNAKKSKQESDRAVNDAMQYGQVVRKLEKDLMECHSRKEKVENELNIIKTQLGIKK